MLLKQLLGLLGGRYLPTNPVGEHPLVVEKFEEGLLCAPRFFVSQDGDAITTVADDQVVSKATVKVPSYVSEALFYLFPVHFFISLPQTLGSTGLVLGGGAFLCRTTFTLFVLSHFYRCGGRV